MRVALVLLPLYAIAGCASSPPTAPVAPVIAYTTPARAARSPKATPASDASLGALLGFVTQAHPRLRAEHARWRAQSALIDASGRWADPMIGYTFGVLPIETRLGPNRHTFIALQKVPWPTQTSLERRRDRAAARAQAHSVNASYIATRLEIETLYWTLYAIDAEERAFEGELRVLTALERGLQARVEVSARPASALSRLGLERLRLDDRLAELRARRRAQEAALGGALGLSRAHRVAFPAQLTLSKAPPAVDLEAMLARTPAPPHLRALAEHVARRRTQHDLAGLDRLPTFELGLQWSLINAGEATAEARGRDAVMLRLGVSLPIWSAATSAKLEASQARVAEAQARLERARQLWMANLRATHVRAWEAHRRVRLIETTLLVQAQQTLEMVQGDYEADRAEFGALLEAIRVIHELKRDLARARGMRERQIAMWQALLGRPVGSTAQEAP